MQEKKVAWILKSSYQEAFCAKASLKFFPINLQANRKSFYFKKDLYLPNVWYNYSAEQLWTTDSEYCQCCVEVSYDNIGEKIKEKK